MNICVGSPQLSRRGGWVWSKVLPSGSGRGLVGGQSAGGSRLQNGRGRQVAVRWGPPFERSPGLTPERAPPPPTPSPACPLLRLPGAPASWQPVGSSGQAAALERSAGVRSSSHREAAPTPEPARWGRRGRGGRVSSHQPRQSRPGPPHPTTGCLAPSDRPPLPSPPRHPTRPCWRGQSGRGGAMPGPE